MFLASLAFAATPERAPDTVLRDDCLDGYRPGYYVNYGGWSDLDGDGAADLVLTSYGRVRAWMSGAASPSAVEIGDVPYTFYGAVHVSSGGTVVSCTRTDWQEFGLSADGPTASALGVTARDEYSSRSCALAGDVDGDGLTDIAGPDSVEATSAAPWALPEPAQVYPAGDQDGDGFDDAVVVRAAYTSEATLALYRGGPSGLAADPAWSLPLVEPEAPFTVVLSIVADPEHHALVIAGLAADDTTQVTVLQGASPGWGGANELDTICDTRACLSWLAWDRQPDGSLQLAAVDGEGVTWFAWDGATLGTEPLGRWTGTAYGAATSPTVPGPLALLTAFGEPEISVWGWSPTGDALGDGVPTDGPCPAPPVESGDTADTCATPAPPPPTSGSACGCESAGHGGAWAALAALALVRRRRR